jgi:uncharacterized protein (TIGR03067 family)
MRDLRKVLYAALVLGGVAGLAGGRLAAADKDKEEAAVPAEQLTKKYATDPAGFDADYKGKVVTVEGLVQNTLAKTSPGNTRLLMIQGYRKPGEPVAYSVRCLWTDAFADLRIGHKVRVQGTCQGHSPTLYAAELRDCKLLRVLADDYPPGKPVQEEIKKLQGKWKVTSAEAGGKPQKVKDVGFEEITIEGYAIEVRGGNQIYDWGLALDPTRTPKAMDFVNPDQSFIPLIYALEGDKLRLALPPLAKNLKDTKRPEDFDKPAGKLLILVAERQKP